jgi:TRAP transporter TAXI family solute receptor
VVGEGSIKPVRVSASRAFWYAALLALMAATASADAAELGKTIDVGKTGFAVKRPVLASACPHGCPWGELGEFVRDAMAPLGYEVVLCRNCNRAHGPRLVAKGAYPPSLDAQNLWVGTTTRINAPVDFGITSSDGLAWAYKGTYRYVEDGPYENLRLIARIEDPRYLMVAVKSDSGISDLAQIVREKRAVKLLADTRPSTLAILDYYGLDRSKIESLGGTVGRPSIANLDADFDVVISNNASPANNPEAAYWTAYTYRHDLKFLQLPDALLASIGTDDLGMKRVVAKWGLLRGVDRPIATVARSGHAVFGRDDMPEQVAYDIAKAIYANRSALAWYIRPYSYDSDAVGTCFGVPLHPGAERFYREMGFMPRQRESR